jgi:hypothetical protein
LAAASIGTKKKDLERDQPVCYGLPASQVSGAIVKAAASIGTKINPHEDQLVRNGLPGSQVSSAVVQ